MCFLAIYLALSPKIMSFFVSRQFLIKSSKQFINAYWSAEKRAEFPILIDWVINECVKIIANTYSAAPLRTKASNREMISRAHVVVSEKYQIKSCFHHQIKASIINRNKKLFTFSGWNSFSSISLLKFCFHWFFAKMFRVAGIRLLNENERKVRKKLLSRLLF